jgi:hypothetical protein
MTLDKAQTPAFMPGEIFLGGSILPGPIDSLV